VRTPRADLLFLLPFRAETAFLRDDAPGWRDELQQMGVELVEDRQADVAVVSRSEDFVASDAKAIVARGSHPCRGDRRCRTFAALPSSDNPAIVLPLDRPHVASYALETWTVPRARWRRAVKPLLVRKPVPILKRRPATTITIACPAGLEPFLVTSARAELGIGAELDWYLVCAQGDARSRGTFALFERAARAPRWILKFARIRGDAGAFARDAEGLGIVALAGGAAAARAPRLVARFESAGFGASVETAGLGTQLTAILGSRRSLREREEIVERIATWLLTVATQTVGPSGSALPELRRLYEHVLPRWPHIDSRLLDGLDGVPGSLQHNDLGCWNIVATKSGEFTVLDWEDTRRFGLPLWDLWYFLADALALVEQGAGEDRVAFFSRLFGGEARGSKTLFRWTRAFTAALGVPPATIGSLATLCWLHHGVSRLYRAESGGTPRVWPAERYHEAWASDRRLGPTWDAWATA
jgi:hypothetical protein